MVTVQQLVYFLAAAEHGSLSAAASACFIAQPSLSEQVRRLERDLGVDLFLRTNRGLVLTEAGRRLVPSAERAVAAVREAEDTVTEVRTLIGGTVSLGTFSSAHHYILGDVVAEFRQRYPGVRMRIVGHNSVGVADAVRNGQLEAGLVALPVDDRGLDVGTTIWTSEAVYVSAHPSRLRSPVTIEQLSAAPLILPEAQWGNDDPTRRQLVERAQRAGLAIEPIVEVESPAAALDLAARGVGDTVVSRTLVSLLQLADRLGCVSLDPPLLESFAFITPRAANTSPATAALIELAQNRLAELQD
ncbi:MAG: LysR family transcriptional regulator [Ilumatobacteraceae bacterium]|nr:LysR family transcriptional regulator [Ilumatobacteraceae bacterium]